MCYYGFEFTDDDVVAYDQAHNIKRPDDAVPSHWVATRKQMIMQEKSRELGILLSTRLAPLSLRGGNHQDIVYFALQGNGRLSKSFCPTVERITLLMRAMGVAGEPRWIAT